MTPVGSKRESEDDLFLDDEAVEHIFNDSDDEKRATEVDSEYWNKHSSLIENLDD